ncbi:MAG TPA: sugar ABC transporter [Rikenellaceae bacterium]|nr:sugar ABC transporter [Rikenellaceae bacterium]
MICKSIKAKVSVVCLLAALFINSCSFDATEGRTYYVDSEKGSDSNAGTAPLKAWKTLDKASALELNAGDKILLKKGCVFEGVLTVSGKGRPDSRVIIDAYGEGEKPLIEAPDSSLYAVLIRNSDYLTLQNIGVTNHGSSRLGGRTGVKVLSENYGISRNIVLNSLNIHDVNGVLAKREGGGSGILIENRWKEIPSAFDSLIIENCTIRRCERNAMIWSAPWDRQKWFPSTNTIVRRNLIEEVPGDGIVPIGCDGALIEYNLMRDCTEMLPPQDAAAGIWPWACDNTVIRHNEVEGHKAPWDAQGFDCDYGCNNTVIQYNYSHDNYGGMVLVCTSGTDERDPKSLPGNENSLVEYNVSINDGQRPKMTRGVMFSPIIHVAGPVNKARIEHNILHMNAKPAPEIDRAMIVSDCWGGYADSTLFSKNLFYAAEPSSFDMTESTCNHFEGNWYLGKYNSLPNDADRRLMSSYYEELLKKDPSGFGALSFLFDRIQIANGESEVMAVNEERIREFFGKL